MAGFPQKGSLRTPQCRTRDRNAVLAGGFHIGFDNDTESIFFTGGPQIGSHIHAVRDHGIVGFKDKFFIEIDITCGIHAVKDQIKSLIVFCGRGAEFTGIFPLHRSNIPKGIDPVGGNQVAQQTMFCQFRFGLAGDFGGQYSFILFSGQNKTQIPKTVQINFLCHFFAPVTVHIILYIIIGFFQ